MTELNRQQILELQTHLYLTDPLLRHRMEPEEFITGRLDALTMRAYRDWYVSNYADPIPVPTTLTSEHLDRIIARDADWNRRFGSQSTGEMSFRQQFAFDAMREVILNDMMQAAAPDREQRDRISATVSVYAQAFGITVPASHQEFPQNVLWIAENQNFRLFEPPPAVRLRAQPRQEGGESRRIIPHDADLNAAIDVVRASYSAPSTSHDSLMLAQVQLAREAVETYHRLRNIRNGEGYSPPATYDQFRAARAALYILNPPGRETVNTSDPTIYALWREDREGNAINAPIDRVEGDIARIRGADLMHGLVRETDIEAVEGLLTTEVLVNTISELSMRRSITSLNTEERYVLEYAIDQLARIENITQLSIANRDAQGPVVAVSTNAPHESLVESVNGRFAAEGARSRDFGEEEILADIRGLMIDPDVRRAFQQRISMGTREARPDLPSMTNVVHTSPVEEGARLTGGYFRQEDPNDKHEGHDFGVNREREAQGLPTRVYASAPGAILAYFRDHPSYGNCVILAHADGTFSLYAHMAEAGYLDFLDSMPDSLSRDNNCSFYLDEAALTYAQTGVSNMEIERGTQLGVMGNTGRPGIPVHLHYEQLLSIDIVRLRAGEIDGEHRLPIYGSSGQTLDSLNVAQTLEPQVVIGNRIIFDGTSIGNEQGFAHGLNETGTRDVPQSTISH